MSALLTIALLALTLPFTHAAPSNLHARTSGELTWYNPSAGTGACGQAYSDSNLVVAVSAPLYDSLKPCDRSIRVAGPAGTVEVAVVDRCGGCAYHDLDLSPAAFKKAVGDLGVGRTSASWEWM
ncbi:expansin-like protein [Ilyonectria destructans]|nr:expansin-like protein [Ilyonectria destructans]